MAAHIVATETMAATWIGSPRISFSQDLIQQRDQEDRTDGFSFLNHGSPVNSDFDFCVSGDECVQAGQLSNTADLLFSNGKILPIPIPIPIETKHYPPTAATILDKTRNKSTVITDGEEQQDKSAKTAFWKFGRSSSLNCGGGGNMSTILCSSLMLLSRSKSTGSNSNLSSSSKQQQQQKKNNGQRSSVTSSSLSRGKLPKMNNGAPSSTTTTTTSYHGYYGKNGVRITPILNVPYMPKGISGFRHFLTRGKNNNSRKKHMLNC